jgi:hypothetical protein
MESLISYKILSIIVIGLILCCVISTIENKITYSLRYFLFVLIIPIIYVLTHQTYTMKNNSIYGGSLYKIDGFTLVGPSMCRYWKDLKMPYGGSMEIFIIGDVHQHNFLYDTKHTSITMYDIFRSKGYINDLAKEYNKDKKKFSSEKIKLTNKWYLEKYNLNNCNQYFITDWLIKLMCSNDCIDIYMESPPINIKSEDRKIYPEHGFLGAAIRTIDTFCTHDHSYLSEIENKDIKKSCPPNIRYHAVNIRSMFDQSRDMYDSYFRYVGTNMGLTDIVEVKHIYLNILNCIINGESELYKIKTIMLKYFYILKKSNKYNVLFEELFYNMLIFINKQFIKSIFKTDEKRFLNTCIDVIDNSNRKIFKNIHKFNMFHINIIIMDLYTLLKIFIHPSNIAYKKYHGDKICGNNPPRKVLYYAGASHINFLNNFINEYFKKNADLGYNLSSYTPYNKGISGRSIKIRNEPFM